MGNVWFAGPKTTNDRREIEYKAAIKLVERCRDLYAGMRKAGHEADSAHEAVVMAIKGLAASGYIEDDLRRLETSLSLDEAV